MAVVAWQGYLGSDHSCQGCEHSLQPCYGVMVAHGVEQLVTSGSVVESWTAGMVSHGAMWAWHASCCAGQGGVAS